MRIILAALGLTFLMLGLAETFQAKEWRGIVPLRSKREDVERQLGKAASECKCYYNLPEAKVYVKYSSGSRDSSWDAPKGTVIGIDVYPATALPRLSDLKIDERRYRVEEDSELPGIFYYVNEEEGFTIVVEDGWARAFHYTATAKDKLTHYHPRRA
jgi:hypothetical protein